MDVSEADRTRWLAVVAFPPRCLAAVGTGFRRSCGAMRPSDFSRPFAMLSFRSSRLPLAYLQAEAERSIRNASAAGDKRSARAVHKGRSGRRSKTSSKTLGVGFGARV